MKHIIFIFFIALSGYAQTTATPFWFSGREEDWTKNKNKALNRAVELLNYPSTNTYYTTNDVPYYVTNLVHTADNTNNVLWQINFGYTNALGENCWIMGYTAEKCGGYGLAEQWAILDAFCKNNKKFQCQWDVGLTEHMATYGYGARTNAWLTNSIPFVDDAKKANERKSEFKKKDKK